MFEVARIAAHSPRIGATHVLLGSGFSGPQIQLSAGWKSERMVALYGREIKVQDGAMAQWFRGRTAPAAGGSVRNCRALELRQLIARRCEFGVQILRGSFGVSLRAAYGPPRQFLTD